MKKIISIVVCVAALSLVGCSSTTKSHDGSGEYRDSISQIEAGGKMKCKYKNCYRKGKLGAERVMKDTAK